MYDYENGYDEVVNDDFDEAQDDYETMEPEEFLEKYL